VKLENAKKRVDKLLGMDYFLYMAIKVALMQIYWLHAGRGFQAYITKQT